MSSPNHKCRTGKAGYSNHRQAMMAVGRIVARSRRDCVPDRAYHCHHCRCWHLTSQPREVLTHV